MQNKLCFRSTHRKPRKGHLKQTKLPAIGNEFLKNQKIVWNFFYFETIFDAIERTVVAVNMVKLEISMYCIHVQ